MGWTFVWLMVILKIPIAALFYIVWWAIRQSEPDAHAPDRDGGVKPPHRPRVPSHPRRRGPHGAPGSAVAPPRVRSAAPAARARSPHHL
jgi:hypothetical protein